jgi:hypothetical protein
MLVLVRRTAGTRRACSPPSGPSGRACVFRGPFERVVRYRLPSGGGAGPVVSAFELEVLGEGGRVLVAPERAGRVPWARKPAIPAAPSRPVTQAAGGESHSHAGRQVQVSRIALLLGPALPLALQTAGGVAETVTRRKPQARAGEVVRADRAAPCALSPGQLTRSRRRGLRLSSGKRGIRNPARHGRPGHHVLRFVRLRNSVSTSARRYRGLPASSRTSGSRPRRAHEATAAEVTRNNDATCLRVIRSSRAQPGGTGAGAIMFIGVPQQDGMSGLRGQRRSTCWLLPGKARVRERTARCRLR